MRNMKNNLLPEPPVTCQLLYGTILLIPRPFNSIDCSILVSKTQGRST